MFTVCIEKAAEGFRVYVESEPAEAGAMGGPMGNPGPMGANPGQAGAVEPAAGDLNAGAGAGVPAELPEAGGDPGQTVGTLKEALTLAMEALRSDGGQIPDIAGQRKEFDQGFGSGQMGGAA